jgi:hypothetical protein
LDGGDVRLTPSADGGDGPTRRHLLRGVAVAGGAALAGCSRYRAGTGTDLPVDLEGPHWRGSVEASLRATDVPQPSGTLEQFAFDVGFARDPLTRARTDVLASDVAERRDSLTVTLRPDLRWSNGDPLTAADAGRWLSMLRRGAPWLTRVPAIRSGERRPRSPLEAITDVEWDGRTLTVSGAFDVVGRPLPVVNAALGRRPRAYYDPLWAAFRDAFDDEPWEDEGAWDRVTGLVSENIWRVGEDLLPEAGIALEHDHDGSGIEAAYSGLWYPVRDDGFGNLYFARNDAHPFADRVNFDTVVWSYRQDPGQIRTDLVEGIVDGKGMREVTERLQRQVPSDYAAFEGQTGRITTVALNHLIDNFWKRDVRAALQYALDRDQVVAAAPPVTAAPVSEPGADLQSPEWVPDSLRSSLRSYDHDPERAAALLERAGFRRVGDRWRTPDGDRFRFQLLTTNSFGSFDRAIAKQLQEFGVAVTPLAIEETSYQARIERSAFYGAMSVRFSPNAAGVRTNRPAAYAEPVLSRNGFRPASFLQRPVADAVETTDGLRWVDEDLANRLVFDDVEDLRAVTVEAPPLGDPSGPLREWPYLYHAARVMGALDDEERRSHARKCTWVYNYQVPELELVTHGRRIFHRTDGWSVPDADDTLWKRVANRLQPAGLLAALAWGHVSVADGD